MTEQPILLQNAAKQTTTNKIAKGLKVQSM